MTEEVVANSIIYPSTSESTTARSIKSIWMQSLIFILCLAGTPLIVLAIILYVAVFMVAIVLYILLIIFLRTPYKWSQYLLLKYVFQNSEEASVIRINPFTIFNGGPITRITGNISGVNDKPPQYDQRDKYELVSVVNYLPRYQSLVNVNYGEDISSKPEERTIVV